METKKIGSEAIGWIGSIVIFIAYALNSFHIIEAKDIMYQILNGLGAAGIAYISFKKKAFQPGVLNIVWLIIALFSLMRAIL